MSSYNYNMSVGNPMAMGSNNGACQHLDESNPDAQQDSPYGAGSYIDSTALDLTSVGHTDEHAIHNYNDNYQNNATQQAHYYTLEPVQYNANNYGQGYTQSYAHYDAQQQYWQNNIEPANYEITANWPIMNTLTQDQPQELMGPVAFGDHLPMAYNNYMNGDLNSYDNQQATHYAMPSTSQTTSLPSSISYAPSGLFPSSNSLSSASFPIDPQLTSQPSLHEAGPTVHREQPLEIPYDPQTHEDPSLNDDRAKPMGTRGSMKGKETVSSVTSPEGVTTRSGKVIRHRGHAKASKIQTHIPEADPVLSPVSNTAILEAQQDLARKIADNKKMAKSKAVKMVGKEPQCEALCDIFTQPFPTIGNTHKPTTLTHTGFGLPEGPACTANIKREPLIRDGESPDASFQSGVDLLHPMENLYAHGEGRPLATDFRPSIIKVDYNGNEDWDREYSVRPKGRKSRRGPKRLKPKKPESKVALLHTQRSKANLNIYLGDA